MTAVMRLLARLRRPLGLGVLDAGWVQRQAERAAREGRYV